MKQINIFLLILFTLFCGNVCANCDYPTDIGAAIGSEYTNAGTTATITPNGWKWNCCDYYQGNDYITINGGSSGSSVGYIASPVLSNGCSAISFSYQAVVGYGGSKLKIEIKQNSTVVWSDVLTTAPSEEWSVFTKDDFDYAGEFELVITNTSAAGMFYPKGLIYLKDLCITKHATVTAPSAPTITITGDAHPDNGFWDEATVSLSAAADANIFYTTDEGVPTQAATLYSVPFKLTETTRVKAIAVVNNLESMVLDTLITVSHIPENMVKVSVTMNSVSRTMTLAKKGANSDEETPIVVGNPAGYVYTFPADAGDYILTGYNASGIETGTMEIAIFEGGEMLDGGGQYGKIFKLTTVTAYASNSGWVLGTDYDMECFATSREGITRTITTTIGTVTAGRETFLMQVGDSYRINYTISPERVAEGYLSTFNISGTVTATSATAMSAIPASRVYSLLVPKDATLYVGAKPGAVQQSTGGTHYVAFSEILPDSSAVEGTSIRYYYTLGDKCTYNYRASQQGKLTNGGKFTVNSTILPLEITEESMNRLPSNYINHDTSDNSGANVADILLNINSYGHLKMTNGENFQLVNLRSWQLTDNSTNNYFLEPDYHYRVIGTDGNPSSDVISIGDNGLITAKAKGTAIVQVTYDAIDLWIYNGTSLSTSSTYYYGSLWSAIWPENTGTFVVTVDEDDAPEIIRNMHIQENKNEEKNLDVDAEHDVFYYLDTEPGYTYTFKPAGVAKVSIAHPTLGENIANYNGFTDVPANEDGSYTLLLKFGRNIIRLSNAAGASEYQLISAKPVSYEILNATNPGAPIQPGDNVKVQFKGFYHPANKLAGIYNMSAYLDYNDTPNGSSIILSPNQYQFAGTPSAQAVTVNIPADWDVEKPYKLTKGAIQVKGYGSNIGEHRGISLITGRNPNFVAVKRVAYFGAMPDVSVPVQATKFYAFTFSGLPVGASLALTNSRGEAVVPRAGSIYIETYGSYNYEATCEGYAILRGTITISTQSPELETHVLTMIPLSNAHWDGSSTDLPEQVSNAESLTAGGPFEGMEGYYKIGKGSELAWFANAVNTGSTDISAILTDDIWLSNFSWTPIGKGSTQFAGTFNGGNHIISALYIKTTADRQGLFGNINGATIKNLTLEGHVETTGNYTGGIVGYTDGAYTIHNCHNRANVRGGTNTGGVLGYSTNKGSSISNCTNSGNITSTSNYAGGIAGNSSIVPIINAINTGNITTASSMAGGIAGGIQTTGSVTNAYNTGASTNNAIAGATTCIRTNVYTLGGKYTDAPVKTADEFASGSVTWLLGPAFGQELGVDPLPLLNGQPVYRIVYTNNLDANVDTLYTNGTLPEINREGYIANWHTDEQSEAITTVSADATLYLRFTSANSQEVIQATATFASPNPFTNRLIIWTPVDTRAILYNLTGHPVLTVDLTTGSNSIRTTFLPPGVYFLRTGNETVKLIK